MPDLLLEWLARYGYPVVFVAATLENVFPVGFLVPGEIIVLSAAITADASGMNPVVIALLGAVGETMGEFVSFALGRALGPRLVPWLSRRFPRTADPLARGTRYFREKGGWALVLGRPAWGVKATLPLIAGMSDMPPWKALGLVALSSVYYYPSLVSAAYLLGLGFGALADASRAISIISAVAITLVVIALWMRSHIRRGDA